MKETKFIKPKKSILNPVRIMNNKHRLPIIVLLAAVFILTMMLALPVLAAPSDPLAVINNLSSFIFSLIRAIGLILLGFGILQVGLSLKSHDPSQRANGMLTVAGGVVITFTQEILTLITG